MYIKLYCSLQYMYNIQCIYIYVYVILYIYILDVILYVCIIHMHI